MTGILFVIILILAGALWIVWSMLKKSKLKIIALQEEKNKLITSRNESHKIINTIQKDVDTIRKKRGKVEKDNTVNDLSKRLGDL